MAKDGYGEMSCISCCVSPLDPENEEQRHNIQYFGARVNVLKSPSYWFERWLRRYS